MLTHLVYTFDPIAFHADLGSKVVVNGQLDLAALRQCAVEALDASSPMAQQALDVMRFDPAWMQPSDDEADRERYWYAVLLAQTLRPAPGVRYPGLIELGASFAGWSSQEGRALIFGRSLPTVLQGTGHPALNGLIEWSYGFAGALSVAACEILSQQLALAEPHFRQLGPSEQAIIARRGLTRAFPNPAQALSETYVELGQMLTMALVRREPLLMLFD